VSLTSQSCNEELRALMEETLDCALTITDTALSKRLRQIAEELCKLPDTDT
jgi:hypothetical protein